MSERKYTPGPWRYGSPTDEILTKEGTPICSISVSRNQVSKEQADANARLLAAAPELLRALNLMIHKATKQNWNDKYPDELEIAFNAVDLATREEE